MWTILQFAVIGINDVVITNTILVCSNLLSGATEAGEMLINARADVNTKGSNESTPLILAANGGHVGITKVLLRSPRINVHEQVC